MPLFWTTILTLLVLAVLALDLWITRRAREGQTPLDVRNWLRGRSSLKAGRSSAFDVFVSYKSEDAMVARQVAEALLGSGWRVWFDEYVMILVGHEEVSPGGYQARVHDELQQGLTHSSLGLCFTRNAYFQSDYCKLELRTLLENARGSDRVLNVEMSPRANWPSDLPARERVVSVTFRGPEDVLALMQKTARRKIEDRLFVGGHDRRALLPLKGIGLAATIDASGWQTEVTADRTHLTLKQRTPIGRLYGEAWAENPPDEHLDWSEDPAVRVIKRQKDIERIRSGRAVDVQCFGIHTTVWDRRMHPAYTFFQERSPAWIRQYNIHLAETARVCVFRFHFAGSFRSFCRVGQLMDQLVVSMREGASE